MRDNPQPVKDAHVAFARAIVALAREHCVDMVDIQFRRNSSGFFRRNPEETVGGNDWTTVRAQWSEGRHGDDALISMSAQAQIGVAEREAHRKPSDAAQVE